MRAFTIICLLFFHFSSFHVFSQSNFRDGFIILPTHDTIHGKVEYQRGSENYRFCVFNDGKTSTRYLPAEIVGYGFTDYNFFSSQILTGHFVEVLISGMLSLYKYEQYYYVQKESAELLRLEHKKSTVYIDGRAFTREDNTWKGILISQSFDCPEPGKKLDKAWFKEKKLVDYVKRYNECMGAEFFEYKADMPWSKVNLDLTAGLSAFKMVPGNYFTSFRYIDKNISSIIPTVGIAAIISSPRISERISIQAEAHFFKVGYFSSVMLNRSPATEYHDVNYDLTSLTFPLSLRYTFNNLRLPFHLYMGLSYDHIINSEYTLRSDILIYGYVRSYEYGSTIGHIPVLGLYGGVGIPLQFKGLNGNIGINMLRSKWILDDLGTGYRKAMFYLNLNVL